MLAGCGGSQPQMGAPGAMPQTSTLAPRVDRIASAPKYKVSGPLLYVTNSDPPPNSFVAIYDPKTSDPSPIAVITTDISEPSGDCIDGDGTLYVTNEPGSSLGWISEYALGETTPLRVITTGINIPAECAIDRQGNLWVTSLGGPTVTQYLKGSTEPHTTLKNGLTYPIGVAIDHVGYIYVGNNGASGGNSNVVVFRPGRKSPSRTITAGITWPGGIAVDTNGTLYVPTYLQCSIEEYLAGKSQPYRTITKDLNAPVDLTFAKNGRMYELNVGNQDCNGPAPAILEFRPGSVKPSNRMISKDFHDPEGVAYFPPLLP